MEIVSKTYHAWRDLMDNQSDQRTTNWPLMSSPLPTILMCLSYVYIVKVLGPKLMENRKPFKLREIIILYNFLQVLFSFYLFWEAGAVGWFGRYSWRCEPLDLSRSENAMRMANDAWLYYFSKFTEFFDTFFFVLRKRYDQVSMLHVIHHGIMPMSTWWGVKFMPVGHGTFFGFINTFVHVVMYTYYMLAAVGPQMQKYLWWKKYLTMLQMIQFMAVFLHSTQLFFSNPCKYPISGSYLICAHAVLFLFLFGNFYRTTYKKADKKKKIEDINGNLIENSLNKNGIVVNSKDEVKQFNIGEVEGITQRNQTISSF